MGDLISSDEEFLDGNVGGAVRVGDTVRRPVGPWTPAVHALLAHLDGRLPHVPRVRGFDEDGREVLDFMSGRVVDIDSELLSPGQIRSLVTWARRLHAAVAGFAHSGPWRYFPVEDATLVGHNDIAPYNACFIGDDLAGVFDWDMAGPTTPLMELAFMAWNCVPLWQDNDPAFAATRLRLIASTYGVLDAVTILRAVPRRVQLMLDGIPVAAAAGDEGMANLMTRGEPERSQIALDDLVRRIPTIERALANRLPAQ
jgi:hypothetical protein